MSKLNREGWLTAVAEKLVKEVESASSKSMPDFRVAMGFPSRNGLSATRRRIGECWNRVVCVDGTYQLFISPMVSDNMEVAGVIAHEMIHAAVGTKHGHKRPFVQAARAIGLDGKPTATVPGDAFKTLVDPILAKLGPYPHAGMRINKKAKAARVNPLVKAQCPDCDYKVRITRVWLDDPDYGPPICPGHRSVMVVED